jgi:hypothetical protein
MNFVNGSGVGPITQDRILLAGARGGQGTTTVATVVALLAACRRQTSLLSVRPKDVCALAARQMPDPGEGNTPIAPNLTLGQPLGWAGGLTVVDAGRLDGLEDEAGTASEAAHWLVVRGPCYLSLRAAAERGSWAHGVILVSEAGRALTARDVADVLGVPVLAEVPVEAAAARAIDAGLLLTHVHRLGAFRTLARLVDRWLGALPAEAA